MQLEDLIRQNYERMSANDRRIWQYVCRNREECRKLSLHQLADACEVSHTTVLRFLQLIGMDGYNEFKTFLKWSDLNQPVFDERSIEQNSFNLTRTVSAIQQTDCSELFGRMNQAKRLYAYGSGAVQKAAAKVLKDYLILAERLLHVIEGKEERRMAMEQMEKGDVVFLFSLSGNNQVMNDYAGELRDRGMYLVAICQDGVNDLSKICQFYLPFFTQKIDVGRHGMSYHSSAGMFSIAETLLLKYAAYQADRRIKLVATDLDGTLLDNPYVIPQDFVEWVCRHPEVRVVIASGRQYYNLRKLFGEIEDKLVFIAENGGFVFDGGRAIYRDEMAEQDILACIELLGETQTVILCGEQSAYMLQGSAETERNARTYYEQLTIVEDLTACIHRDRIVKIAVFFEAHNAEEKYADICECSERLKVSLSGECWIDIANSTANKGAALSVIQGKYHIARDESMAFGDYLNDYELLQQCGMSYAMENAHPDLKKIAKYIAPSNKDRGVQKVLAEIIP